MMWSAPAKAASTSPRSASSMVQFVTAESKAVTFEILEIRVNDSRFAGEGRHRIDDAIQVFVFDPDERESPPPP